MVSLPDPEGPTRRTDVFGHIRPTDPSNEHTFRRRMTPIIARPVRICHEMNTSEWLHLSSQLCKRLSSGIMVRDNFIVLPKTRLADVEVCPVKFEQTHTAYTCSTDGGFTTLSGVVAGVEVAAEFKCETHDSSSSVG